MKKTIDISEKSVRTSRVCFHCAMPIHEETLRVCPRCGSTDIDARRARPTFRGTRESVELPHPWKRLALRKGGTIVLSGGPGSGKTTICTAARPNLISTSEQEIEEVAAVCNRVNPGEECPTITSVSNWEELEEDIETLAEGQLGIVDSISQLASGPRSAFIMRRTIEKVRSRGAMVIFVTQYTKDGEMFGPNELRHLVDVVSNIPEDKTGLRRLSVTKNRFGGLFSTYFSLSEHGVRKQVFPWAYSVEGPPGNYSFLLYPMEGGKFNGILKALEASGKKVSGVACSAIASRIYRDGFVEPDDVEWRKKFAEEHGLNWIGPKEAWEILSQKGEKDE